MAQSFEAGDFLVFQLEAGYALLRVLGRDGDDDETVWHLAAYEDMFPDIESAEIAASQPDKLKQSLAHAAITNRAFESTQVAKLSHQPLTSQEKEPLNSWDKQVADRSIRLLLGLR